MPAKKTSPRKAPAVRKTAKKTHPRPSRQPASALAFTESAAEVATESPLLVCIQDPFPTAGVFTLIGSANIPCTDGNSSHQWRLEALLEINPPRFFEGWATEGVFTLDLKMRASVTAGAWGDSANTPTSAGSCRILVMRDGDKVKFSLSSGAAHAPEKTMPRPDLGRFLNGDIGFELNGTNAVSIGATAVTSKKAWSNLIAGSTTTTKGLAFDSKWRSNLEKGDGDAVASGSWSFAIMTRAAYRTFCAQQGHAENIV